MKRAQFGWKLHSCCCTNDKQVPYSTTVQTMSKNEEASKGYSNIPYNFSKEQDPSVCSTLFLA